MNNTLKNFIIFIALNFVVCSVSATKLDDLSASDLDSSIEGQVDHNSSLNDSSDSESCSVEVAETGEKLEQVNLLSNFEKQIVNALSNKKIIEKLKQKINDLQAVDIVEHLSTINKVSDLKMQVGKAEIDLLKKELENIKKKLKSDEKTDELYITMFFKNIILNPLKGLVGSAFRTAKNATISYCVGIVLLAVIAEILPIGPGELFGYFGINMKNVLYAGFYTVPSCLLKIIYGAIFDDQGGIILDGSNGTTIFDGLNETIIQDIPFYDPWLNSVYGLV